MDQALRRRDQIRAKLLLTIYEITHGIANRGIDVDQEMADRLGVSLKEAQDAREYLVGAGLLRKTTIKDGVM